MRQEPVMGKFDQKQLLISAFQNSTSCFGALDSVMKALSNGIGPQDPFLTKPIRVSVSVGFQHRIECQ